MHPRHMTGPGSGVLKYDILTALAIAGLHGTTLQQVSMLRLIVLMTARYNWQRNELSIGQAEMAQIWGVDPRTAKREVKRLIASGLLEVVRPGVRGRVASYRLNLAVLEQRSRPVWDRVGSDFAERAGRLLGPQADIAAGNVLRVDFAAPRGAGGQDVPKDMGASGTDPRWQAVLDRLAQAQPDAFANWFRRLALEGTDGTDGTGGGNGGGTVRLRAPNAFVSRYVETHLVAPLQAAVADAFGAGYRVALRG